MKMLDEKGPAAGRLHGAQKEVDTTIPYQGGSVNCEISRTEIIVNEIPELHERSRLMLEAVAQSGRPVYQMDGTPVRIKHTEKGTRIEPVNADAMRHEISQSACCLKELSDGSCKEIDPPIDAVRDALASAWMPLAPINGVACHPVVTDGCKIISRYGYNRDTGLFIDAPPDILQAAHNIPIVPSDAEVRDSIQLIGEVVYDFPFDTPADKAGYYALLLTLICRPMITGQIPAFMVQAATPGTGKSLLVETAIKIITGAGAIPTAFTADEEEARKILHAALLSGCEYILLDNINFRLKSAVLCEVITAGSLNARILGYSKMVRAINNATFVLTSNNPDMSREVARRCVPITLSCDLENPASRTDFKHPDLDLFIRENRPALIRAALVMTQAWAAAEWDTSGVRVMGSFEGWSRTIGGILKACGIPGFLENTADIMDSDSDAENWTAFITEWYREHEGSQVKARELLPMALRHGLVDSRKPESFQLRSLGRLFSRKRNTVHGGIKVIKSTEQQGNLTWKALKVH